MNAIALDMPDAWVEHHARWLEADDANRLMAALEAQIPWEQAHIRIQGNDIALPRLTSWHGERAYRYSGILNRPNPWTPGLLEIRDALQASCQATFNSVLCNLYRGGSDSVAWHADDERELGDEPVIASVSLGQPRKFSFKRKDGTGKRVDLVLGHGDLLVMRGKTQRYWVHQVPKTKQALGRRINLTYRNLL